MIVDGSRGRIQSVSAGFERTNTRSEEDNKRDGENPFHGATFVMRHFQTSTFSGVFDNPLLHCALLPLEVNALLIPLLFLPAR
jgi:hypothetical protein